jgi:hypothetical protein
MLMLDVALYILGAAIFTVVGLTLCDKLARDQ